MLKRMGYIVSLITMIWLILPSTIDASEIDTLFSRLEVACINDHHWLDDAFWFDDPAVWTSEASLNAQNSNGSWSDIDYSDTDLTNWTPNNHMLRLRRMAISFRDPNGAYYNNSEMRDAIVKGVQYFFDRKPTSSNWWWREIGLQCQMGPVLIMMRDHLSAAQLATGCSYLQDPGRFGEGDNCIMLSQETVWRGCLQESQYDIDTGLNAIKGEIKTTTATEGIQPDWSTRAHGPQLYNAAYGLGFLTHIAFYMGMTRGLSFEFSQEHIDIAIGGMLDGTQWMMRWDIWDHACMGRAITWAPTDKATMIYNAVIELSKLGTPRTPELLGFADNLTGKSVSLVGNKHFWRVDFQSHQGPGYYASVKMCSKRVVTHEQANGDNLQGLYLDQGAMSIVRHGQEYRKTYPVWDWGRIPGTTTPHKDPAPASNNNSWHYGTTDFVGGASNGTYGAVGFDFNWYGAQGRKAWFFFDNEIVCLGAGIGGDAAEPIYTSINQTKMFGPVWASEDAGQGSALSKGERTMDLKWAHHDSVGYVFPTAVSVAVKNESQSGTWYEISSNQPQDNIDMDVFSLWLDHGVRPSGKSYEYIVVPAIDKTSLQSYAGDIPVRIISNTTGLQAVRQDRIGVSGAVFYNSGQVEVRDELSLQVNQPSITVIQEEEDSVYVSVANPKGAQLTVSATLLWANANNETKTFNLPGGGDAGKSITKSFINADPQVSIQATVPKAPTTRFKVISVHNRPVVSLYLSQTSPVKVSLIQPNGRIIAEPVNRTLSNGKHAIPVTVTGYSSGIYIVRLETENIQMQKKLFAF